MCYMCAFFIFSKYDHVLDVFIFRETGGEGEEKKYRCVVASPSPPTGDQTYNPGRYHDWELNQQTSGSQDDTQSTEPHQPGHIP